MSENRDRRLYIRMTKSEIKNLDKLIKCKNLDNDSKTYTKSDIIREALDEYSKKLAYNDIRMYKIINGKHMRLFEDKR